MKPNFRTNLDICKSDIALLWPFWPSNLVPRVGEHIQMLNYQLEVVEISYEMLKTGGGPEFRSIVELHAPSWFKGSITEWEGYVKIQRNSYFAEGKSWPPA